jgi:hypothetical protein
VLQTYKQILQRTPTDWPLLSKTVKSLGLPTANGRFDKKKGAQLKFQKRWKSPDTVPLPNVYTEANSKLEMMVKTGLYRAGLQSVLVNFLLQLKVLEGVALKSVF